MLYFNLQATILASMLILVKAFFFLSMGPFDWHLYCFSYIDSSDSISSTIFDSGFFKGEQEDIDTAEESTC